MCLESNAKILTFIWCPSCYNVDIGQVASRGTNCKMSNPSLQCADFDFKLDTLYSCMACMVVKILTPFLEFCKTFFTMKAHNMFRIMLDSHYKGLHVCKNSLIGNVLKRWCKIMIRSSFFHSSQMFHNFWFHIVVKHLFKLKKYMTVIYLVLKLQMKRQHMPC